MSAVLLVPGSWHGAWCYEDVADRLTAASVDTRAIDLPSNDGASGLADDAAAVREALAAFGEPAVVVGHSYGGVAISEGAGAAAGLVYLCAFMLDEGESLLDAMQHELPDWIELDERATSPSPRAPRTCSTPTARQTWRRVRVRGSPASRCRPSAPRSPAPRGRRCPAPT